MKSDIVTAIFTGTTHLLLIALCAYTVRLFFGYLTHRLDVLGCDILRRRCEGCGEPIDRCPEGGPAK